MSLSGKELFSDSLTHSFVHEHDNIPSAKLTDEKHKTQKVPRSIILGRQSHEKTDFRCNITAMGGLVLSRCTVHPEDPGTGLCSPASFMALGASCPHLYHFLLLPNEDLFGTVVCSPRSLPSSSAVA